MTKPVPLPLPEAFEARVRKVRGHWLWTGKGSRFRGATPRRIAWELDAREIEPGKKHVLVTTCDEPTCVNPEHLRLVSQAEKVAMTTPRGEDHYLARLTSAAVLRIRELHAEGLSFDKIAARMGLTSGGISHVVTGRTWGHVR
ncbi:hypothetical protein K0U83_17415 [bacterium]|nr:hypothetical protein [bacterium]